MSKTVSQEMSLEQRTNELVAGLQATGEEKVFINLSHLAQIIGMEKAVDMAESLTEQQEVVDPRTSPRSTLRVQTVRNAVVQINRADALEACLKAKAKSTKAVIDEKLPVPKK
jgi:hypothetical protein